MKITDIKKSDLPLRVKLTEGFTLEESFDPGMIVQINNFSQEEEWGGEDGYCYKIYVTALSSDYPHNKSVASHEWYDKDGYPTLDIFQARRQRPRHTEYNPEKDDWSTEIYVMGNDDAFELVPENKSYVLETLNSIDENGDICSIRFEISEETKNVLNALSSLKVKESDIEYTITDLKFSIYGRI